MTVKEIQDKLFELRDEKYAAFQAKLIPTASPEQIIGVRVPKVRELAKALVKEGGYDDFLKTLPHDYYDEDMLHGAILTEIKDYEKAVTEIDRFLPYVNNWAVCDTVSPKAFKKNKPALLGKIREWMASDKTYTIRFGMEMLMSHFLDADFKPEYLEGPANIRSDEYYVNMMTAWFFATALAKQWDATLPYIENNRLDTWTHNKSIQKARESYRITPEQKELLNKLKRKEKR